MLAQRLADLDLTGWQAVLDRHPHIFFGMQPGSRIGLMSKDDFEPPTATMVVWEATAQAMQAKYESFPGFDQVKIDLLFIADDPTLRRIHDAATLAPFAEIKTKVRRRDILLYVVKPRRELFNFQYSYTCCF